MVQGWVQIALFVAVVMALTPPLGGYMARVFGGPAGSCSSPVLGPFERFPYQVLRVDACEEQDWKRTRAR